LWQVGEVAWVRRIALIVCAAVLLFAALLALEVHAAWDLLFGLAYCLDGYPPCGTRGFL